MGPTNSRFIRHFRAAHTNEEPSEFAALLDEALVVLLGEPGAGKTHLFKQYAGIETGATYLTARQLLISPIERLRTIGVAYIDGLDERRAHRNDAAVLDEVVRRLMESGITKCRIACRVSDWLGETDSEALRLLETNASAMQVVVLQRLNESEQIKILRENGIEEPERFLMEADRRQLTSLLGLPQNLIMLVSAVRDGHWPRTRAELNERATAILLAEKNPAHARKVDVSVPLDDIKGEANAALAIRLLADIEGFSLAEHGDDQYPNYCEISKYSAPATLAALCSRLFSAAGKPEAVDYSHRTIAEFLAAKHLAAAVESGCSLRRISLLLGVHGVPFTELRGLHAWFAIFVGSAGDDLLRSDPFGVVAYADASLLTPQRARVLFDALLQLAEDDPYFRNAVWEVEGARALAIPSLTPLIRDALREKEHPFGLRLLFLESLQGGELDELTLGCVWEILRDDAEGYGMRELAMEILCEQIEQQQSICDYVHSLGTSEEHLRLRSRGIRLLFGRGLDEHDVSSLVIDVCSSSEDLIGGIVIGTSSLCGVDQMATVLDEICARVTGSRSHPLSFNEGVRTFEEMLIRILENTQVEVGRLAGWLDFRARMTESRTGERSQLSVTLTGQLAFKQLVDTALIRALSTSEWDYDVVDKVKHWLANSCSDADIISVALAQLEASTPDAVDPVLCHTVCYLALTLGPEYSRHFHLVVEYAAANPSVLSKCSHHFSSATAFRRRERIRARWKKRKADREYRCRAADFDKCAATIVQGKHAGWVDYLGKVWFGQFSDVDRTASGLERLEHLLGASRASTAVEGLRSAGRAGNLPSLKEVLRLHSEGKYFTGWYGLLAGVSLRDETESFSDEQACAALAIEALLSIWTTDGSSHRRADFDWVRSLQMARPEVASCAYARLVEVGFLHSQASTCGLEELLGNKAFQSEAVELARKAIRSGRNLGEHTLARLLRYSASAAPDALSDELAELDAVGGEDWPSEQWTLMRSAVYLLKICRADSLSVQLEVPAASVLWGARRLMRRDDDLQDGFQLTPLASALLAKHLMSTFPMTFHPRGSSVGSENLWDATDWVKQILGSISAKCVPGVSDFLRAVAADPVSASYKAIIGNALAGMKRSGADSLHSPPSYRQVLEVLRGGPPVGLRDGHALIDEILEEACDSIRHGNTDGFKRFWNEDQYGRPTTPKVEESCRDVLVDILRARAVSRGIVVEPEVHLASDNRGDVGFYFGSHKVTLELKRESNSEVWSAISNQLDRYSRDPASDRHGVFGVFWFGGETLPAHPKFGRPSSAQKLREILQAGVEANAPVSVFVFDVSRH